MKKIFIISVLFFLFFSSFAQIDTKHINFYKNCDIGEFENIKLSVKNPIAKFNYSKFEFVIENKSENYLHFIPGECKFKYETKEFKPKKKKTIIIKPGDKKSPTLKVEGGTDFHADKFEFIPGGFSVFAAEGTIIEAPDFHLPPNKNDFTAGNFKAKMLKLKKETSETVVQFQCFYSGNQVGIISPSKIIIRTEDGTEWANAKSKAKQKVLFKGEKTKFTVIFQIPGKITDMQFAVMDISFKDAFTESELKPISFSSVEIVIDEGKTEAKNK